MSWGRGGGNGCGNGKRRGKQKKKGACNSIAEVMNEKRAFIKVQQVGQNSAQNPTYVNPPPPPHDHFLKQREKPHYQYYKTKRR